MTATKEELKRDFEVVLAKSACVYGDEILSPSVFDGKNYSFRSWEDTTQNQFLDALRSNYEYWKKDPFLEFTYERNSQNGISLTIRPKNKTVQQFRTITINKPLIGLPGRLCITKTTFGHEIREEGKITVVLNDKDCNFLEKYT